MILMSHAGLQTAKRAPKFEKEKKRASSQFSFSNTTDYVQRHDESCSQSYSNVAAIENKEPKIP